MLDETFVSWCQSHGSVINGISCQHVDHGYRGIVATRDLSSNEVIVHTPHPLLLSNASHPKPFKDALLSFQQQQQQPLTSFQTLACLLIYESCQGPSSFWAPYLSTIPPHYTTHEHLSPQDIAALQLPSAINKLHSYRQKAIHNWKQARPFLLHLFNSSDIQKEQEREEGWATSWETWAWASATLNSRTMHIAEDPTGGVLNPFGDMFNYSPPPPPITPNFPFITHQNSREEEYEDDADDAVGGDGGMNVATGYYEIKTKKSYTKGDQVFLCYGRYTNLELLIHYGFVLLSNINAHDTVMIPLEYFPPPVVKQFNAGNDANGNGEAECCCYVHADGSPSWKLAKALRLGVLSVEERKRLGYKALGGEMVSEKGEEEGVRVMREVCRKTLLLDNNNGGGGGGGGLGLTTLEEDEEMLLLRGGGLKDTMRVVVEWRVEQKRILKRCMARMETWMERGVVKTAGGDGSKREGKLSWV